MDFNNVTSIYANGPVNISAAASADKFIAAKDGIKKANNISSTFAVNYAKECSTPRLAGIIGAGAALVFDKTASKYFDQSAIIKYAGAALTPEALAAVAPKSAEEFADMQRAAVTLVAATKVNYFKMAHHTGQGVFTGYAAKAAKVLDVAVTTEADISAVWRLGHWFDTRRVLSCCGVKGIRAVAAAANNNKGANGDDENNEDEEGADDDDAIAPLFEVSPEVAKRISTNPAGTAPLFDCLAAIEAIKVVPVINMIESAALSDYAIWKAAAEEVLKNPAHYHTGAKYLTGRAPKTVPTPPEYVFVWLKSVLEVTGACATLLDSAAFKNVNVNVGVVKSIKAAEENATGARPDSIKTLSHYVAGAAPVKVAGAKPE